MDDGAECGPDVQQGGTYHQLEPHHSRDPDAVDPDGEDTGC
ncbi:hypothetical protein ABZ208_36840 [Streptomyces sp. NPDC006208]